MSKNHKSAVTRRARQTKSPVAQILSRSVRDQAPLHVLIDDETFATATSDMPPIPREISSANRIFNVTASYESLNVITTSTTLNSNTSFSFILNSINQVASYTALFDQYRIMEVEARFIPRSANFSAIPYSQGLLTSVIDYDDASVVSTPAAALDYQSQLTVPVGQPFVRRFKPHIAVAAYNGSFGGFSNAADVWIDAASPDVQHYGMKLVATPTNTAVGYDMIVKLWCQFRNVR